jgi:fructose-1,6-bisphosphatase I
MVDGGALPASLAELVDAVSRACGSIAKAVERGALDTSDSYLVETNVHGETQKPLDVMSNDIMVRAVEQVSCLAGWVSEEIEDAQWGKNERAPGAPNYLLLFDPLDGSSNLEINSMVGSIFSVLELPRGAVRGEARHFLQPGTRQVCAGYAIYGATTMFVFTTGNGVDGFSYDSRTESFVLTHAQLRIPESSNEFAINMSNERFWELPVKQYVRECVEGARGIRQANFNMRWIASMVAEVHRILIRGGVFLYPRDTKNPRLAGRLRLMYEANPMSFIVEQAGGDSTTGTERMLDIEPEQIHQRVPVILGSKREVERIAHYHASHAAIEGRV